VQPAGLVLVVGPCGADKDTLIGSPARALAGEPRLVVPRRVVTRPASAAEAHDTLSPEGFEAAAAVDALPALVRARPALRRPRGDGAVGAGGRAGLLQRLPHRAGGGAAAELAIVNGDTPEAAAGRLVAHLRTRPGVAGPS
jgi:ribose 1,5-bisphosphokinase